MATHPPELLPLPFAGVALRRHTVADADAIARCVGENLEHLRAFMPWAQDDTSADADFQRERLGKKPEAWDAGEEFGYVLVDGTPDTILATMSLMTRRGPGTLEIGYWLAQHATGRGYATEAARALTDAGFGIDGVETLIICCDEANVRSAAIPQRIGYTLDRVEDEEKLARDETGRLMWWTMTRAEWARRA